MLVQSRLAGEVVPAPDEHDRRQAEAPRGLEHLRLVASEEAAADEEDGVGSDRVDRGFELGVGRDLLLQLTKRPAHTTADLRRELAVDCLLPDRPRLPVPGELEYPAKRPATGPAGVVKRRAEETDEIRDRAKQAETVGICATTLEREFDSGCARMAAHGRGKALSGAREDELHSGVEKLEEELGQPLHRRRARDD